MVGGVEYDAVVLLRGKLATVGDVKAWIEPGLEEGLIVREPGCERTEQKLKEFLEQAQDHCERGGETYGSRMVPQRGDVETMSMVQRLAAREREGRKSVERLTGLMRDLQQANEAV
jgi:hypothetical protein